MSEIDDSSGGSVDRASALIDPPPVTGHHDVDRALAGLRLGDDVAEHPAAIAAALDALQSALNGPTIPDALRPR